MIRAPHRTLAAVLLVAVASPAAGQTWTGNTNNQWNTAANWSSNPAVPLSSADTQLIFGTTTNNNPQNNIPGTFVLNRMTFNAGAPNYSFSGIQQGTVNVNYGSLAKGTGYYEAVNVTDGGVFAPGNSITNTTSGLLTLNSGSTYEFEINRAAGTAGGGGSAPPVGWDLLNLIVGLNVNSTSASPAIIKLMSRNAADTGPGTLPDFNPTQGYEWLAFHVNTGGTVNGFSSDKFTFDTASFANLTNPTGVGTFALRQVGNDVFVTFTPVPEPGGALALLAVAVAAGAVRTRRRN